MRVFALFACLYPVLAFGQAFSPLEATAVEETVRTQMALNAPPLRFWVPSEPL
jgi:hypothetical protein